MLEYICCTIIIIMFLVGASEMARAFSLWLFEPGKKHERVIIIPIRESSDNTEYIIRGERLARKWNGGRKESIVIVNCGADEETAVICRKLCESGVADAYFEAHETGKLFESI